ncbi:MAG TPA: PDC sensor domain-containing protein [Arenicellales bacterium]|nr:PDC sensor domain-containing protein [Arenicellales bacterium]
MRRFLVSICVAMIAFGAAARVVAQQGPDRQEVLEKLEGKLRTVRHVAFHPAIVRAVRIQNSEQLGMELIQERDSQWRSSTERTALQRTILSSRASEVLKKLVEQNSDFNEAFATDNQGANVAMFPATSDYWQGDEDKWIQAFNQGDGRLWIGEIEVDESTGLAAVQVSVPIVDQGATIGVLVIGITQDYLQQ